MCDPWIHSVGWEPGVAMSHGVGCRCSSGPVWLWLWCRPRATALIGPLAWELPYAVGAALKRKKERKKKEEAFSFQYFHCSISFGKCLCIILGSTQTEDQKGCQHHNNDLAIKSTGFDKKDLHVGKR